MKKLILTVLTCCFIVSINAQIFDRILDRTQDKLSREISNKIVEKISDEITRAAMKPVDRAIDDMLKERYEQDSIEGKPNTQSYDDFISAYMTEVDLPEAYDFDMTLETVTKDYDGTKHESELLLTKNGSCIGVVQYDEGKKSTMVFDMTNDIMAVYSDDKEGKKVFAMPSMLSASRSMMNKQNDGEIMEATITNTGKTKKMLGYVCELWEIEDETNFTKAYVAPDFPITWQESFSQFLKELMPTTQRKDMPEGMILKSESKTKKKNKKTSYEVKKVIDEPFKIINSDYEKTSYSSED